MLLMVRVAIALMMLLVGAGVVTEKRLPCSS